MRLVTCSVVVALSTACSRSEPQTPAPPPAQPAAQEAPAPAAQKAYLLYAASVMKQANDEKKSEWLATLYRGEELSLLKQDGEWSQVRTAEGKEGFMKSKALLPAEGVTPATLLDEAKTFYRPTFMAPSKVEIPVGSLLFIIKESPDKAFSEVNYLGTATVWIESGKLTTDSREVQAAMVVTRARSLDEQKKAEAAKPYWDIAKSQFGDTQVVVKVTAPAEAAGGAEGATPAHEGAAPPSEGAPQGAPPAAN